MRCQNICQTCHNHVHKNLHFVHSPPSYFKIRILIPICDLNHPDYLSVARLFRRYSPLYNNYAGRYVSYIMVSEPYVPRFTQITLAEAGEYICTAENPAGKTTAIGHLDVQTVPVVTITPSSGTITVSQGQHIRFECKATGLPAPTVQWSRHLNVPYAASQR